MKSNTIVILSILVVVTIIGIIAILQSKQSGNQADDKQSHLQFDQRESVKGFNFRPHDPSDNIIGGLGGGGWI